MSEKRDITTQHTLTTLYTAFDKLNAYYFNNELPTVCIMIADTDRRHSYGWFTVSKIWTDDRDDHRMHEIAISASAMKKGMHFVIGVLLHELIHLFCSEKGIKDTSNGVTYHNSKFKEEAEKRDLLFKQEKPCKINGWYSTVLSEDGELFVDRLDLDVNAFAISRDYVETLDAERVEADVANEAAKKRGKRRNSEYSCESCDIKFKAKKGLNIVCGDCLRTLEEDTFELELDVD